MSFVIRLLPPTIPEFELTPKLITDSFAIAIVGFSMCVSLSKIFALKHGYSVDGNQVSEHSLTAGDVQGPANFSLLLYEAISHPSLDLMVSPSSFLQIISYSWQVGCGSGGWSYVKTAILYFHRCLMVETSVHEIFLFFASFSPKILFSLLAIF